MMYIAFLRGINVGGNNIIKMQPLTKAFEEMGFQNVQTVLASGNIIFSSHLQDKEILCKKIEEKIDHSFHLQIKVLLLNEHDLDKILEKIPEGWINDKEGAPRLQFEF